MILYTKQEFVYVTRFSQFSNLCIFFKWDSGGEILPFLWRIFILCLYREWIEMREMLPAWDYVFKQYVMWEKIIVYMYMIAASVDDVSEICQNELDSLTDLFYVSFKWSLIIHKHSKILQLYFLPKIHLVLLLFLLTC